MEMPPLLLFLMFALSSCFTSGKTYTKEDMLSYREEVREMFNHAYSGYLHYAYPYDELRPLTCDGVDTWGSYSLTLIDALDTLAVMGNYTEFARVANLLGNGMSFNTDTNVSVFETNIRIVGGLLSAHMLSHVTGIKLEDGWPCDGPLLRLAKDVADRIMPAFNTTSGMPYGTVNLKTGVPPGETTVTCTAGIGTFIIEFGTLSRLTGDPKYEEAAMRALNALFDYRSNIDLMGNHIDIVSGKWTATDSGIGAGVDSYFEYLVKGALLFSKPELMDMFRVLEKAINEHLKYNDWFFWVSMHKGVVTLPLFQSLEAYWPGLMSLMGKIKQGVKSVKNYHSVWKKYGFTPEFYNIVHKTVSSHRERYPLRPELVESVMYLYKATGDPYFIDVGVDIMRSISHSTRTECGFATVKNVNDHSLENRMESFFLSETLKYLYLLFDTDNFIHGAPPKRMRTTWSGGRMCLFGMASYIFNTEAHPVDPGLFDCCSAKGTKGRVERWKVVNLHDRLMALGKRKWDSEEMNREMAEFVSKMSQCTPRDWFERTFLRPKGGIEQLEEDVKKILHRTKSEVLLDLDMHNMMKSSGYPMYNRDWPGNEQPERDMSSLYCEADDFLDKVIIAKFMPSDEDL